MEWPEGKPIIRHGTLPTPEDPAPSNQVIEEYPDGRSIIRTGNPDEKILNEYREALSRHPEDAGLHRYYGISLAYAGQKGEAISELRQAARLAPADPSSYQFLGATLADLGRYDEALPELHEALRLIQADETRAGGQGETLVRCGLSTALERLGRHEEAVDQLRQAVELQRGLLAKGRGSKQLLRQLEEAFSNLG